MKIIPFRVLNYNPEDFKTVPYDLLNEAVRKFFQQQKERIDMSLYLPPFTVKDYSKSESLSVDPYKTYSFSLKPELVKSKIDTVAVWDRELSTNEVRELYDPERFSGNWERIY